MNHTMIRTSSLLLGAFLSLLVTGCDSAEPDELELLEDEQEFEGPDEIGLNLEPRSGNNYFTPVGTHDAASCNNIAGWVKDGDTTAPTYAHIYRGAPYPYGEYITSVYANLYRGDLPFSDKNHGFSISTPADFKTGWTEQIYIHGINVDASGNPVNGANNPLLSQTGKTICCNPNGTICHGPFDPEYPAP